MLFSKECILKEKFSFLPLHLVTNPFLSLSLSLTPPPLPPSLPAAAVDCIIDANTVTCVRSGGSSSLLLCNTLSENIKWRKQPHARGGKSACQWSHSRSHRFGIVSSRWLRTKKCGGKFQLTFRSPPPHTLFIFVAHPGLSSHLNTSLPNSQIFLQISSYLRRILSTSATPNH